MSSSPRPRPTSLSAHGSARFRAFLRPLAVLAAGALLLTGCAEGGDTTGEGAGGDAGSDTTIRVASHMPPMTDVVEVAGEVAEEEGWTVELVQVSDNVQYNRLLADGEVDANFAQHEPYMQAFNAEHDAELTALAPIYDAKVGFYSAEFDDVADIPEGAQVAIPNDASNEGRALAILDEHGLISLAEGVGFEGRISDIEENPKDLEWVQVDLLNLSSAYEEDGIALVYNYPTYIARVGLTPQDAILLEETVDQRFAIQLVARAEDADTEKIEVLEQAMTSDEVRDFLEEEHSETLLPAF
ncbi:MetQ/NlpA family ABC transporter substrate-binding protein [Nesterenkonia sp. HG001]|uniref:MetQ/NlpA family ABC transporter substrate-binding protein n=1 Tax=Nesterenkonia sp. HG001 TaxID=2983207 RepID=UPI002AC51016|nr:MetQ/NlpA family ABC transporter substrate-binding protein [Nesterenkonia sp. HG001]MDZ5077692.1 MetQ/NlpA family ABC transporter substrate-binding protein [Nesterenkonia sp. HG001]